MAILFCSSTFAVLGGDLKVTTAGLVDSNYGFEGARTTASGAINHSASATAVTWYHFRGYANGWSNGSNDRSYFWWNDGTDDLARININNGLVRAECFGDTITLGSTFSYTNNLAFEFDAKIEVDATNITISLYMNGALVSTATAANTSGLKTVPVKMYLSISSQWVNFEITEFIVTDNEDTRGWRLAELQPDADGNYTAWAGDYTDALGDATRLGSPTAGQRSSFSLSNYLGEASPSSIRAIVATSIVDVGGTGPQNLKHFLRISATDYDGANVVVNADQNNYAMTVWDDNPNTVAAWATSELNALESGLLSQA